jgi:hypothetical protein
LIALAIATGIPVREWLEEGDRTIITALDLLQRPQRTAQHDQRQMSG